MRWSGFGGSERLSTRQGTGWGESGPARVPDPEFRVKVCVGLMIDYLVAL